MGPEFRALPPRWDPRPASERIGRHRHCEGHFAIVLAGWYDEAGDVGRRRARPGTVLVQRPFQAHADAVGPRGARILCLPLPDRDIACDAGSLADPDAVVRLAETDVRAASLDVAARLRPAPADARDWPDALADALQRGDAFMLEDWAERHGLARETLSRGFRLSFGVAPSRYRAEVRALRAWRAVVATRAPLAGIAAEQGFADQAHMTREVRRITGRTPGAWRGRVN
jgi:AraC-like DNA-binding protein